MERDSVQQKRQKMQEAFQQAQQRLQQLETQQQTLLREREQISQEYLRLHGAVMILDELLAAEDAAADLAPRHPPTNSSAPALV
jgi:predicted  nucleic acid-binding Zn-ribbon protein